MSGFKIPGLFRKKTSVKISPNLLIFLFFLLLSALLWFINALNKEYTTEIIIPVEFINSPENNLLAEDGAKQIKVKITALGYRVINYKTRFIVPILINLKQYPPKKIEDNLSRRFFIKTQMLKDEISALIGRDLEIKSIGPDSLIFSMDQVITKKLPVRKNFELICKKQFILKNEVRLIPDSIIVKGVKSMLDTVNSVYTIYDKYTGLDDLYTFDIDLLKIKGTEFSVKSVTCIADVEEYSEITYELPIEVINLPVEQQIKIFPTNAKISFNVGFSRYQSIFSKQFSLVVDYKEAANSKISMLKVNLARSPDNISSVRIYPKSVDYIIEKND